MPECSWIPEVLLVLESEVRELQCLAIFRHGTHDRIGRPFRKFCCDLEGHSDIGPHEADQMSDDFFGDSARISPDALRVEVDGAVEATRFGCEYWRTG